MTSLRPLFNSLAGVHAFWSLTCQGRQTICQNHGLGYTLGFGLVYTVRSVRICPKENLPDLHLLKDFSQDLEISQSNYQVKLLKNSNNKQIEF